MCLLKYFLKGLADLILSPFVDKIDTEKDVCETSEKVLV